MKIDLKIRVKYNSRGNKLKETQKYKLGTNKQNKYEKQLHVKE